jgi:enoyl-[acyl-carrier protein] reductase I
MKLLEGKKALILGVANQNSIAYGIAKAFFREGASLAFACANDFLVEMVKLLAKDLNSEMVIKCDVSKEEDILNLKEYIKEKWGNFDILVHSIAFAPKEEFKNRFLETSREGFKIALDVSVYSLIVLCRELLSLMNKGGSVLTLSFYGSEKVFPGYNVMGVAKAALESTVRYLAYDLGKEKIRVNCISPGPIKTLAASAIPNFENFLEMHKKISPLGENVTNEEVGELAVFLVSEKAKSITGQVIYVDAGYNIMGIFPK